MQVLTTEFISKIFVLIDCEKSWCFTSVVISCLWKPFFIISNNSIKKSTISVVQKKLRTDFIIENLKKFHSTCVASIYWGFLKFPVWCKFLTTVECSPFHSAISQVLHGSASIMVFMATLLVIDFKALLLQNFFKPMLSWLLTDGSLDKCLVDIAISFCCSKFHFELIQ